MKARFLLALPQPQNGKMDKKGGLYASKHTVPFLLFFFQYFYDFANEHAMEIILRVVLVQELFV